VKHSRLLYLVLLSLYSGLLFVLEEMYKPGSVILGVLGYPLVHFIYPVIGRAHQSPDNPRSALLMHTVVLWLIVSIVVFVLVYFLMRISRTGFFFQFLTGAIITSGFAIVWLHLGNLSGMPIEARRWLGVEVVLSLVLTGLYLLSKASVKSTTILGLLILHFAFWGWTTFGYIAPSFWTLCLLLGICTFLCWAEYHRSQTSAKQKS
jgi:hypothetical protein